MDVMGSMGVGSIGGDDPSAGGRIAWQTPTIEDYGIVAATRDIDLVPGIDAFEASNPAGYGS